MLVMKVYSDENTVIWESEIFSFQELLEADYSTLLVPCKLESWSEDEPLNSLIPIFRDNAIKKIVMENDGEEIMEYRKYTKFLNASIGYSISTKSRLFTIKFRKDFVEDWKNNENSEN